MPVRLPPLTDRASRILLEGLVDYAGLFAPAALAMPNAVRNYAHYRAAGAGWMLGRFICPAQSLALFSETADPLLPRCDRQGLIEVMERELHTEASKQRIG